MSAHGVYCSKCRCSHDYPTPPCKPTAEEVAEYNQKLETDPAFRAQQEAATELSEVLIKEIQLEIDREVIQAFARRFL